MKGKLIVIEGTDCSGKETQTKLLIQRLRADGFKVENFSFPNYNSPTGKIIGGPYLGKPALSPSYFDEGATHVDPKVASLYYAADRKYNIDKITFLLDNGAHIILDRYIYSNMAHQGGKLTDPSVRVNMYNWLEQLEFQLLNLPKPDIALFLHMPTKQAQTLKVNRLEVADAHEKDMDHLLHAEKAYIELAKRYNMYTVECCNDKGIRTIEDINDEIYTYVYHKLKTN